MTKKHFAACYLLLLFALPLQAGEIYRCTAADGKTLYQQVPCAGGVVVEDRTSHYESDAEHNAQRRQELLKNANQRIQRQKKENRAWARVQQKANKARKQKQAQCNRINKRIESLTKRMRRKSKANLRRQRDKLWDEHHKLDCSLFIQ